MAIPRYDHGHTFSFTLRTQQALNFLAHFHLAQPTDGSRIGALLGDFIRGTPESLRTQLPLKVIDGIILHRAIDRFTDSHKIFLQSKELLSRPRRRFAGIIIDIYFDHFLAGLWSEFSEVSLPDFTTEIYATLRRRADWIGPEVSEIARQMQAENWLTASATIPGLALTFHKVSHRRTFLTPLIGAEEDLANHYQIFKTAFRNFYPEVMSFASERNPGGPLSSP